MDVLDLLSTELVDLRVVGVQWQAEHPVLGVAKAIYDVFKSPSCSRPHVSACGFVGGEAKMAKEGARAVRIVKELPCRLALLSWYMDDLEVVVVSQFQVYGPSLCEGQG